MTPQRKQVAVVGNRLTLFLPESGNPTLFASVFAVTKGGKLYDNGIVRLTEQHETVNESVDEN